MSAIFNRITHIITIFIALIVLVTCHVTSLQQRHSNISAYFHDEIDFKSGIRSYRVLAVHGSVVNRDPLFGESNIQSIYKASLQKIAFQSRIKLLY